MTETQAQLLTLLRHDPTGSAAARLVLGAFLTGRVAIAKHFAWRTQTSPGDNHNRSPEGEWAAVVGAILAKDSLLEIVLAADRTPADARLSFECAMLAAETEFRAAANTENPKVNKFYYEEILSETLAAAFIRRWFWLTPEQRSMVLGTWPTLTPHQCEVCDDKL